MDRDKIFYSVIETPLLKKVFVASTKKGVCRVDFHTSEKGFLTLLKETFSDQIVRDDKRNGETLSQLRRYVKGRLKKFDCPLDLKGTSFQKRVWAELLKIPYGETRSYQDIAKAIGHRKAYRAVGNANGSNPVPIIIPCHRVIESNGGLGGYGQGIDVKKRLLDFEKAHAV